MKSFIYLLFLLLTVLSVVAQKKAAPKIDTIIKEVPVYSKMQADSLQQVYFEMLKSTNEQLNNYWTPVNWSFSFLSILITVLGLLFAGGSIWAGIFIYRQGKDFEDRRNRLFDEFRQKTDDFVEKSNTLISNTENRLSEIVIEGYIQVSKLREKGKEQEAQVLEDVIEKVDNAQQKISRDTHFKRIRIDQLNRKIIVVCPKCEHRLEFYQPHTKKGGSVKCTECNHVIHFKE